MGAFTLPKTEVNNYAQKKQKRTMPASGFAALSHRTDGKKPIIAAVNGLAYGGGTEAVVNCDIVVAASSATFALPEVKRGLVPWAGAPQRLVRTVGKQRAMEMVLTGRPVSAAEAERWGLVNRVVEAKKGHESEEVVKAAVEMAKSIAENSPDAIIIIAKKGVEMGWEGVGAEEGTRLWNQQWNDKLMTGDNLKEGVKAFVEKRKPKWTASKL